MMGIFKPLENYAQTVSGTDLNIDSSTLVIDSYTLVSGSLIPVQVYINSRDLYNEESNPLYTVSVQPILGTGGKIDTLQTNIDAKPDTLLELTDTPSSYDDGLYLKSTTSGIEWATASGGGGIDNIVEDTKPQLGGTLELNEKAILVDAVLASDHTWTGSIQSVTAGEELTIGETAYLKSDGKYWLANADAEVTADTKLVMATTTISGDATGIVLLPSALSFFRDDSTTEWTITAAGDTMFLSTTGGELTNDVSGYTTGDIVRICGYMETATVLNFDVDKTFVEVA